MIAVIVESKMEDAMIYVFNRMGDERGKLKRGVTELTFTQAKTRLIEILVSVTDTCNGVHSHATTELLGWVPGMNLYVWLGSRGETLHDFEIAGLTREEEVELHKMVHRLKRLVKTAA